MAWRITDKDRNHIENGEEENGIYKKDTTQTVTEGEAFTITEPKTPRIILYEVFSNLLILN